MKRLGVYLIYDKEAIVDRYIGYMLKELKTCVSDLIVVCNMPKILSGEEYINNYADEVYFRENIGYDAGGYKDTLCDFLGWERVLRYDELVLVNDSFFGPFVSMTEIFAEMEGRASSFWGLTKHKQHISENGRFIEEHIQSYFLTIRFNMLHEKCFREFWENMTYASSFQEAIDNFEIKFSVFFKNKGFSYECLADMEKNDTQNIENNFNQYVMLSNELIRKRNFPFLKKQQIRFYLINKQTQENLYLALKYVKENTSYDIGLIWEHIIRKFNISELQKCLCLQYIIGDVNKSNSLKDTNSAIAVNIDYSNSVEYVLEYLEKFKCSCNIFIFSRTKKNLKEYKAYGYEIHQGHVFDAEAIKILKSYDYVCVINDEDMSSDVTPSYHGKALFYRTWENLLKNQEYVCNVLEKFCGEEFLGILTVPNSVFGSNYNSLDQKWRSRYIQVKQIADQYGFGHQITREISPFAIIDSFWIRGSILGQISEFTSREKDCLPLIWGYIAQNKGFYSGIVESADYAAMNEINLQYMLNQFSQRLCVEYGLNEENGDLEYIWKRNAIQSYCYRHEKVYIYGTGQMAKEYSGLIKNIKAYVVSDGQFKMKEFNSKNVIFLSELFMTSEEGLVVCLDKKNQAEIIPLLESKGIKEFFWV